MTLDIYRKQQIRDLTRKLHEAERTALYRLLLVISISFAIGFIIGLFV
jgi:hypothetical protein